MSGIVQFSFLFTLLLSPVALHPRMVMAAEQSWSSSNLQQSHQSSICTEKIWVNRIRRRSHSASFFRKGMKARDCIKTDGQQDHPAGGSSFSLSIQF